VAMLAVVAVAVAGAGARAVAADLGAPGESPGLEVHGFVSQGAIKSTANNYLAHSARGSFEFTEVGVNLTTQLTEKLRVGVQLFARKLGPTGDFSAKTDWFYLDYRFRDWLGLRAGRVKLPFGLYNDTSDIDAARVPILLPQSVYPIANRDFLLAQTGLELYGFINLRAAGALDYRLYAGTIFLPVTNQPGAPFAVQALDVPYLAGGRLLWETPLEGLRLGGSVQALRLDTTILSTATGGTAVVSIPVVLSVGSIEYGAGDLLLSAEYSRWYVRSDSSNEAVFPASPTVVSERAYGMAAYRVRRWLAPGAYYSLLFPNVDNRTGRENVQHDVAATLRFDVNNYWLVKLEGHYMHGTAALDPVLNGGAMLSGLTRDWAVFLIKTTAYF
jgi:hypothetical protein